AATSAGFFWGKPVGLDPSAVALSTSAISHLIGELQIRDIRVMGIEGVEPPELGPELPPFLKGGRSATLSVSEPQEPAKAPEPEAASAPAPAPPEPASLLIESTVRSGQSAVCPPGDVTVHRSVASRAAHTAGRPSHRY